MTRKQVVMIVSIVTLALALAGMLSAQAKKEDDSNLMDINSASLEKLMTLNEVDLMTARRIVAGRPYQDKKQLVSKKVMTTEAFDKISRSVTARPPAKEAPGAKKKPF